MILWTYFRQHQDDVLSWLGYHAWLCTLPVAIGLIIALPLGWVAARYKWSYPPIIGITGLLYTVPSIALFVVLPGLLGTKILDPINVVAALSTYSVALLVRSPRCPSRCGNRQWRWAFAVSSASSRSTCRWPSR
jgi:osmoprotectant transport system permease protein